MKLALRYLLFLLAGTAILTGLNVLIGGASAIPGASGAVEATVDNELRFFSAFWLAYGCFCFWVAKNITAQHIFIPFIAIVFFVGGVGRLISTVLLGIPSDILLGAMILEFILPITIYYIYQKQYQ